MPPNPMMTTFAFAGNADMNSPRYIPSRASRRSGFASPKGFAPNKISWIRLGHISEADSTVVRRNDQRAAKSDTQFHPPCREGGDRGTRVDYPLNPPPARYAS